MPAHREQQSHPGVLTLQSCNAAAVELHAQDIVLAGQDANILKGEGRALPVSQLEGVQENGLFHTAPHHIGREGIGLGQPPVIQWHDLNVTCKESILTTTAKQIFT